MALAEDPLQRVEGEVIVVAREQQMDGQAEAELALGNQARRQGRDHDSCFPTAAGELRADRATANELGRNQVGLFGDFFADALLLGAAVGTKLFFCPRLPRHRLGFQPRGQGMTRRTPLGPAPALVPTLFLQHSLAERRGLLCFLLKIAAQLVEVCLLLGR